MLDSLRKGLHQDNLFDLIKQCDANSKKDPVIYFVLEHIFKQIESQYQDGQIPLELSKDIEQLIPLIQTVLTVEGDSQKIQSLESLISAFKKSFKS